MKDRSDIEKALKQEMYLQYRGLRMAIWWLQLCFASRRQYTASIGA